MAGIALLQAAWIAVIPPFRGTDEFDHAYRAAGVADGQWRTSETTSTGRGLLVRVPKDLVLAAHDQCAALEYTGPGNCAQVEELAGEDVVSVASGAGGYSPIYYWIVGSVARPFDGAIALYVMRAASAALSLFFLALAAWIVGLRRAGHWSRIGLVVSVPPVMLYSMSVVAPNGLEMAASAAFWCALIALDGKLPVGLERKVVVAAGAAASVLIFGRMLGPLFALCILLTAWLLHPALLSDVWKRHRRLFLGVSGVVLLSLAWAISWFVLSGSGAPGPERQGGDWRWMNVPLWIFQSIAAFPFRNQAGPPIVYAVVGLAFLAIIVSALRVGTARHRAVVVIILAMSIVIPLALTALTYDGRGAMWQGRYGLPYALGAALIAAFVLDEQGCSFRYRRALAFFGSFWMAVATAACLTKIVSEELMREASVGDAAWHPPTDLMLYVWLFSAWILLYVAVTSREGTDDHDGEGRSARHTRLEVPRLAS